MPPSSGDEQQDTIEEELVEALTNALLIAAVNDDEDDDDNDEPPVEGLDEDLISYIAGMLAGKVDEEDGDTQTGGAVDLDELTDCIIDEVLIPFLDSVQCPDDRVTMARNAVSDVINEQLRIRSSAAASGGGGGGGAGSRHGSSNNGKGTTAGIGKLTQGVVSMSSNLNQLHGGGGGSWSQQALGVGVGDDEGKIKAQYNTTIDAHTDKTSSKEKRKARKVEAEKMRKLLSAGSNMKDPDQDGGLVRMNNNNNNNASSSATREKDGKKDVQVRNVSISLNNGTVLLENSELKFAYQRRYGLIGENGVGKSTLLRAIASGTDIEHFPNHLRVLHVRQEVPSSLQQNLTVLQAVIQSDVERNMLLQQEKEILARLESSKSDDDNNNSNTNDDDDTTGGDGAAKTILSIEEKRKKLLSNNNNNNKRNKDSSSSNSNDTSNNNTNTNNTFDADIKKLDDIYDRLQMLGSDSAEARAAMILSGLQFTPTKQHGPISALSGGWKMRVALAAALFIEPDICLLDEPTNHLDLEAVLWLETYLADYPNTLVVVSHDRGFLNEVCTDIIEFKKKKLTYYRGNFDTYIKLRDENIRNGMRLYQAYMAKREHMMEFIEKFRANAKRSTMVQSRIKTVEKMDADAPPPVEQESVWRFSIPSSEPVSRPIISINDVTFDYNPILDDDDGSITKKPINQFLLQDINFGVDLDSRIAILGANGQGKTTLLNLVMGKIRPLGGSVHINSGLRIGHFTQHSSDNFNLKESAVENMLNIFENAEDQEIRSFLGKFQIQGNDALKPMILLSGGQKSRVAFATLAYKKPHVLIIDEGSNHLSMDAVDALVEAINDFQGGVLVVSHDQYFVSKTCKELWVVHEGLATRFRGDFDEYKKYTAELTKKRVEESVKRMNNNAATAK